MEVEAAGFLEAYWEVVVVTKVKAKCYRSLDEVVAYFKAEVIEVDFTEKDVLQFIANF